MTERMVEEDDIQPYSGGSPAVVTIEVTGSNMVLNITGPEHFRRVIDALYKAGLAVYGDEALERALSVE